MKEIRSYTKIESRKLQALSNIVKLSGTVGSMTADYLDGFAKSLQYKREIRGLMQQIETNLKEV